MSEKIKISNSWEEIIVSFFENKVAESSLFKARKYINEKESQIKSENDDKKLEKLIVSKEKKYNELVDLRKKAPSTEIRDFIQKKIVSKNNKGEFIDRVIDCGDRIKKATHILKFTHTSSAVESIFLKDFSTKRCVHPLLSTSSLKKDWVCDMAHNNGALITISRFLALMREDKLIIDLILNDDFCFLEPFKKDQAQFDKWKKLFKGLVEKRSIKTADKAKQTYFPVSNKAEKYHLLVPLFSSTIAEEIYNLQARIKYGDESVNIRKAIYKDSEASKYHPRTFISYPNLAVQKFGGSQPQNVSMLNKERTWKADSKDKTVWGVTYLFSSTPPICQSQPKAPIYQYSFFDVKLRSFASKNTIDTIDYLRDFLIRFDKIDISIKHPERKKWIDAWVKQIIDDMLAYVASIQNMKSGWSATEGIRLKREHQLFLDPYREDEAFQAARKANDWQVIVCEDFARWLNKVLVGKEKQFSPQQEHTRMWISMIKNPLREYDELISMDSKSRSKGR